MCEVKPELARFVVAFKIVPTSLIGLPRDLSDDPEPRGDCQDFAKTVARIEGVKFPRAIMIRCWSREGKPRWMPRHAILWVKGKGFIDSTHREYRKTPWADGWLPFPAWPVGSLFVVAGVQIGEGMGWWPGLFALGARVGLW